MVLKRKKVKIVPQSYSDPTIEIEDARQTITERKWRFFWLPIVFLWILVFDMIWEILRNYMCTNTWPWKFTLLGTSTSASLAGALAGLILARQQFAMTVKPNISWSTSYMNLSSLNEVAWVAHLMNVGPGTGIVEGISISFKIQFENDSFSKNHVSTFEVKELLNRYGLREGIDYYLRLLTRGLPLPPVKVPDEGILLFGGKTEVFNIVKQLDFHLIVVDSLGDKHCKSLPFVKTMPTNYKEISANSNYNNKN